MVLFQDLLMLANFISTQSSIRPYHEICNLLNQGLALKHLFLSLQMHQPWSLKPPHYQYWKSGMLHKNPLSLQNIPTCGNKPLGQQGTRSWSLEFEPMIEHLFIVIWNPLVWLLRLKLQMKIYLPRMHNTYMFLQFCKSSQIFHKLWKCPNQQEFKNILRWTYCHMFHGQWPQLWQLPQRKFCVIHPCKFLMKKWALNLLCNFIQNIMSKQF